MGAHYVPLVRPDCGAVMDLFRDVGIIVDEDALGRPVYDEYCLSADPQERLFILGRWQEGFVPELGASARDRAEFAAFFRETDGLKQRVGTDGKPLFAIPVDASSADAEWRALDRISMSHYLEQRGWKSPLLRWYVDYCCRDDYGSTASAISAWAGLHYFAARNGVAANADPTAVVTWPEGNGHLVNELMRRTDAALQTNSLVTRIARRDDGVTLDYFDAARGRSVRVEAAAAIVCLPRFIAARVVEGQESAGEAFSYAPWMVANVTLGRLPAGRGQALAWDNVIFDSPLLGYVVATHQSLRRVQSSTVLTYYWPLSHVDPKTARREAIARSLEEWQQFIVRDLLRVHPELADYIENVDVRVLGPCDDPPDPRVHLGRGAVARGGAPTAALLRALRHERDIDLRRGLLPRVCSGKGRGRARDAWRGPPVMSARPQPWIQSGPIDSAFILAPAFVATTAALVIIATGHGTADVSLWAWAALVIGVDVAHVYSTIYRTYCDAEERVRLAGWLIATPLATWLIGVLLYSVSAALFWCVLAYTAVFHFVRQQYGFVMLYARGEEAPRLCRRLDQVAIYGATLFPLLYWHTHLSKPFVWFVAGDFIALPARLWTLAWPLYIALFTLYMIKETWLACKVRRVNMPRNAIVFGTALSWYVGIVIARGDLVFTLTNVVAHGIPYMALTCVFANHRDRRSRRTISWFVPKLLPWAIALLVVLAFAEEGLWDGLVWREHLSLFPGFRALPGIESVSLLSLIVPLLAVPQMTHYIIDAVIWRLRVHPEWRATLFWRPPVAQESM